MHSLIKQYIAQFPLETQERLQDLHKLVKELAPDVEEGIGYGMPRYKTHGKALVYFAGYKKHIGLYAFPTGHAAFADALSAYKQGKGSLQLPLNKPMPMDIIRQMIQFRIEENAANALKSKKR